MKTCKPREQISSTGATFLLRKPHIKCLKNMGNFIESLYLQKVDVNESLLCRV